MISRLLHSLGFRMIAPILLMMTLLGVGMYSLVFKTVSDFANERFQEDLERNSRDIYGLCDAVLQGLVAKGLVANDGAVRIKKGKVLGEIDEYAQKNNLEVIVYSDDEKASVLSGRLSPREIDAFMKIAGESKAQLSKVGDRNYYVRTFQFELWKWRIVLVKDEKVYAELISKIKYAYITTGSILFIFSLLMMVYLKRVVQAPINSIITSIQTDGTPHYKGTYEFEFLSDNIRQMAHKQIQKQLEISHQAAHDALTGLINRREFESRLEIALQNAQIEKLQHTILYLDLDQFKVINDTCGHVAGDQLLRQLTTLLQGSLRQSDTLARLGGDEFGVLLECCSLEPAVRIAETLRQTVNDFHFVWQDKTFPIGVSIGLVNFGDDGLTLGDVLSIADAACYVAKDKGRNRIHVYSPGDNELAQRNSEMDWIGRIRKALDENRFVLYAQKIIPLSGDGNEGEHHELLIRMLDEAGKLIPPMAFIPAAERYNLMPTLDRWVIKTAFAQYKGAGTGKAPPRSCAINLSGASIGDDNLLAFIKEQFDTFQIPPGVICFEVTETSAIANLGKAAVLIRDLKAMGCRFALDDFGSGMSSFAYLKHLPVDFLKIDGSFVKDMVDDRIDHAMVEAINRIGHVMGIQTIAEFVENDAILAELRKIGVDFAQGYGIGRPQPLV
jgi:diguanylate cyclase (GGDEF)-like protein